MNWLREDGDSVVIRVKVITGASREEIGPVTPQGLRVKLTASPVRGQANMALVELLASQFGIRKSAISIESGLTSPVKTVRLVGVSVSELTARLCLDGATRTRNPGRDHG